MTQHKLERRYALLSPAAFLLQAIYLLARMPGHHAPPPSIIIRRPSHRAWHQAHRSFAGCSHRTQRIGLSDRARDRAHRSIDQCWASLMALQDVCACARTIRVVFMVIFISLGFCQHVLPFDSSFEEKEEENSRNSSRPAVVRSPEYHHHQHPTVRSVALKHVVARGDEQSKNSTSYDTRGEEETESWTDMADHNLKRIGKRGMVPRGRVLKTSNRPPYPCDLPPGACSSAQTCCGSFCVVVSTNPSHCGRCGHMCSKKRECCNGKCRRLATDEKNCGRCGTRCPSGVKCLFGLCGYSA